MLLALLLSQKTLCALTSCRKVAALGFTKALFMLRESQQILHLRNANVYVNHVCNPSCSHLHFISQKCSLSRYAFTVVSTPCGATRCGKVAPHLFCRWPPTTVHLCSALRALAPRSLADKLTLLLSQKTSLALGCSPRTPQRSLRSLPV